MYLERVKEGELCRHNAQELGWGGDGSEEGKDGKMVGGGCFKVEGVLQP